MTSLKFVVYLTCLFLRGKVASAQKTHQSSSIHLKSGFKSVNVGETITLQCVYENDESAKFYWYKQTLGQKPKLICSFHLYGSTGTFYGEFVNNPRFALKDVNGKNHLIISDLRISDSATYYCAHTISGIFEFADGVTVSLKGSGLNIKASVHQSSSETVQPGGSVTLKCTVHTGTCDGEHSVYWFKDFEESHPGFIYINGDRNGQCESKNNTQTHTCVYNLPMENPSLSHNGIYYCAVASCGHILFGNGTRLELKKSTEEQDLASVFKVAVTFTIILKAVLAFVITNIYSCICTESQERFSEGYQDEDSLYYNVSRENNRSRRLEDNTWSECVYFIVKQ